MEGLQGDMRIEKCVRVSVFVVWKCGNHSLRSNLVWFVLLCKLNRGSKCKICARRCRLRLGHGSGVYLITRVEGGREGGEE